ncbi:MAG TPA: phage portal protein [Allosphingosinicella sp.]|nr:phage portal protein [Allosphingosinicella sp.]
MKWFGRKAARAIGRPFLLAGWRHAFAAEPWPRSYEAQVREAYLQNPVAQRCVRLVAESIAWAPVFANEARPDAGALLSPHLLEEAATYLLLHGNAFMQVLQDAEGQPAELYALRPERVTVEADGAGWPAAYCYKVGEAKRRIAARDGLGRPGVVHVRAAHPLDDHYGLGCLAAAAGAIAVHNAAARWNKALLDNAARPSGALVYDPGDGAALSGEQYDRLRAEMEAQFSGADNAGRPLLLEGGLRWQAMSLTPADMDFIGLKAGAAREIALAFGVPPLLLGLPSDVTYANYREANRALWRQAVLPMADRILRAVSDALAAWWPGLKLQVDVDQVGALAGERERLWRQLNAAKFLTDAEKREMLGFAPRPEGAAA